MANDVVFPDLKNVIDNNVVLRFAPFPGGFLHLGHVKALLINEHYIKIHNGKLILRFDDTNPTKEKDNYVEAIKTDLESLGIKFDRVTHSCYYFKRLQESAIKMIIDKNAYMDDTDVDKMRKERGEGIESVRRNLSVDDNVKYFNEMLDGTEEGKKWCLRAKMDMSDLNKCCRDPVLYRADDTPHHKTGINFKAYPTYDFACPIIDSFEGITHAFRANEYLDRDKMYHWIQDKMGLARIELVEFSKLAFKRTTLSKRALNWFIENGFVKGWDDPAIPTIRGLVNRGIKLESIKNFVNSQGASRRVVLMEWDKFFSMNKSMIDPIAPRLTAIKDPVVGKIINYNVMTRDYDGFALHPKNETLGTKIVYYGEMIIVEQDDYNKFVEGEEITLMKWGNAYVSKLSPLEFTLHLEGDYKKTKKKISWLPNYDGFIKKIQLNYYDFLLSKDKLEEGDKIEDFANKNILRKKNVSIELTIKDIKDGQHIQLERDGFYYYNSGKLIYVPDK
jgi:glutamyl-tRNA synthetase